MSSKMSGKCGFVALGILALTTVFACSSSSEFPAPTKMSLQGRYALNSTSTTSPYSVVWFSKTDDTFEGVLPNCAKNCVRAGHFVFDGKVLEASVENGPALHILIDAKASGGGTLATAHLLPRTESDVPAAPGDELCAADESTTTLKKQDEGNTDGSQNLLPNTACLFNVISSFVSENSDLTGQLQGNLSPSQYIARAPDDGANGCGHGSSCRSHRCGYCQEARDPGCSSSRECAGVICPTGQSEYRCYGFFSSPELSVCGGSECSPGTR